MPKRNSPAPREYPGDGAADARQDLVVFYIRLTKTLQEACNREALAKRLAGLRHGPPPKENDSDVVPALSRLFRRLGRTTAKTDAAAFVEGICAHVGTAVSRAPEYVLLLLRFLCLGDEELDLKPICGSTPQCRECQLTKECDFYNSPRKPETAALSPASRMLAGNDQALSDAELISVLLYGERATGQEPAVNNILARYGRFRALFAADPREYLVIRDMTPTLALRLASMAAIHRRILVERRNVVMQILSAKDIFDRYAPELRDYKIEAAVLLMLDHRNFVIRDAWFCDGAPNLTRVGIAELLRPAVREFASRVVLIHNHPSNDATPSSADKDFTRRLRSACEIFGLILVDHVIVAEDGYFSFSESGLLNNC